MHTEATCSIPPIPNGFTQDRGRNSGKGNILFGYSITYRCRKNYTMVGHPSGRLVVTCLQTEQWSEPTPECRSKCNF